MKQFGTILRFELRHYLRNKVFVGVTLIMVLLLAVVMFFPRLSLLIDSEEDNTPVKPENRPVMLIKASSEADSALLLTAFSSLFTDYRVETTTEETAAVQEAITSGQVSCAFVMEGLTSFVYYVDTLSMYDVNSDIAVEALQNAYRMNAMMEGGLSPEEAGSILSVAVQGRTQSLGKDQVQNYFYTYIMILALYMVILLYGQMVATNVATEKSSRAMEVLITSAKPTGMMFGKVIASCLAGFLQLVAIFGSALLFYQLNRSFWEGNFLMESIFNIPPELLFYMLVFFVLGFFIYAFLYGAIGSTASKLEDINTSVMPLTMLFVVSFMVVIFSMSAGSVDNTLMRICSYIPFTSPTAMFTRIAMSTVPWYEILISILILIGSVVGIGVVSAKIYRVGVLLYGTPPKLTAILKAIRKA